MLVCLGCILFLSFSATFYPEQNFSASKVLHRNVKKRGLLFRGERPIQIYYIDHGDSYETPYTELMAQQYFAKGSYSTVRIGAESVSEGPDEECPNRSSSLKLHARAIAQSHKDNVDFALILEDRASFEMTPLWPKSLNTIISELSMEDSGWDVLQLAYNVEGRNTVWKVLSQWKATYPSLPSVTKWYTDESTAPLGYKSTGKLVGSLATVYSRKGLAKVIAALGDDPSKLSGICRIDKFLNDLNLDQYIATPPYFTYRLSIFEASEAQHELDTRMFASQFMSEYLELQETEPDNLPPFRLSAKVSS